LNAVVELQNIVATDLKKQQNEDILEEGEKKRIGVSKGLELLGILEQANGFLLDGS